MPAPVTTWSAITAPASASTTTAPGMTFVRDTFTGEAQNTLLSAHVGEVGAAWTQHSFVTGLAVLTSGERVRHSAGINGTLYYASGLPSSADYRVIASFTRLSTLPTGIVDVLARVSTTTDTRYGARYSDVTPGPGWSLYKVVKGVGAGIGVGSGETLSNGDVRQVILEVSGTSITLFVDGVSRISVADSSITLAGRAGISIATVAGAQSADATGLQLDNLTAETLPSIVTSATPIPVWTARSGASTGWGTRSGASTQWTTR